MSWYSLQRIYEVWVNKGAIWLWRISLALAVLEPCAAKAAAPLLSAAPDGRSNASAGYAAGDFWVTGRHVYQYGAAGNWSQVALPAADPVDAIGGVPPLACYATRRLRAAYAGPLMRVVNLRTQASQDVFARADGSLDGQALRTAMTGQPFVQVSILYDQCGHNDATQPDPAQRPDIAPAVTMGGRGIGIAFDGQTVQKITKSFILPKTLAWLAGTASTQVSVVSFRAWFEQNAGISTLRNVTARSSDSTSWGYAGARLFYVSLTADHLLVTAMPGTAVSPRAPLTPFVAGYISAPAGTRLWMDRFAAASPAAYLPAIAGGSIGGLSFLQTFGYIDLGELLIYSRALTPPEQRRATASSALAFHLMPQIRDTIAIAGDSLSSGVGSQLNLSWPRQMMGLLNRPYIISNGSLGGISATDFVPYATGAYFARSFLNGNARRLVMVDFGSNDLAKNLDAAKVYQALARIIATAHGAGARVLIATILPRAGFTQDGTPPGRQEAQRLALNRLIRANTAGADGLVDFANDPIMGVPGMVRNKQYYFDTIHPTTAGYAAMAADAAAAVNRMRWSGHQAD